MPRESGTTSGRRWAAGVSLFVVLVGSLPYLFDRSLQGVSPLHGWYSGFAFNVTDNCVYLSWMRQYADGAWFHRNLFTSAPQSGHMVNLFYLLLGKVAGWTGLSLIAVYHAARIAAGLAFLTMVWRVATTLIRDLPARKAAFATVAVGSGFGWVPGLWERGFAGPVDTWQPEAVSFLCVYLFPLFTVSLALMLGMLGGLYEAERTGRWSHALKAGACGFALGNIHTYDVITVAFVWLAWMSARAIRDRRMPLGTLRAGLIAAIPTAISTVHMLWVFRTETVFAQRVAVPTLSPAIWWVLLGFGALVPLALVGFLARRQRDVNGSAANPQPASPAHDARNAAGVGAEREMDVTGATPWLGHGMAFAFVWAAANVLIAYVPVSFQRKMLMGAHVPIGLAAGVGLWSLVNVLRQPWPRLALAVGLVFISLTNVRFMLRDRGALRHGGETVRAFMLPGEHAALTWIRHNVPREAVIQPLPWIAVSPDGPSGFVDTTVACFAPGLTGNRVHAGHWGETPDFGATMGLWARFLMPNTPDDWRRDLLRQTGARYLVFSQKRAETADADTAAALAASPVRGPAPYLRLIAEASGPDADVFEVVGLE